MAFPPMQRLPVLPIASATLLFLDLVQDLDVRRAPRAAIVELPAPLRCGKSFVPPLLPLDPQLVQLPTSLQVFHRFPPRFGGE